jgi:hypothetical protein
MVCGGKHRMYESFVDSMLFKNFLRIFYRNPESKNPSLKELELIEKSVIIYHIFS